MSKKVKIAFLVLTVVVPFIMYCVIYYTPMIKNAPYKFPEFESMEIKWGLGNDLVNTYNSATGAYNYLNPKDSLIKTTVKLRHNDLMFLHSKANELGFWNLPDTIANRGTNLAEDTGLRYFMQMKYKRKTKTVVLYANYDEIPKLRDVTMQMQKLMVKTVNEAEERYNK